MIAIPALADEPIEFTDTVVFEDLEPCSGELQTITINFFVSIHEHDEELIVRVRATGHTSAGYIMEYGRETFLETGTTAEGEFLHPWINPATGDKFVAQGRFLEVDGEVLIDDFRLVCRS
ncbi:MAG: hypothetical protein DWQ40_12880 [Actinobacteria bacterium]|nr:MAG: hypothetical protein DWQ40_12880 [Actinomycetota bacterium]